MKNMKKLAAFVVVLVMLFALAACSGGSKEVNVDLNAFYNELAGKYEFSAHVDTEGEMLEMTYPGISAFTFKQAIFKAPMMSAVVNEIALVECENTDDAAAVAKIFEERKQMQADGGAWYPESIEGWKKAQVVTHGNYVALIAFESADEIAASFEGLFN